MGMSLKTNMLRRAWARGSSRRRMKARKPLKTNAAGVSPGCTRLLRKNTYGGGPIGLKGSGGGVAFAVSYFVKRIVSLCDLAKGLQMRLRFLADSGMVTNCALSQ